MIFSNGCIYFSENGSFDYPKTHGSSFFCLDADSGRVKWMLDYGINYFSQPVLVGNCLVFGARYDGLQFVDATTGKVTSVRKLDKESFWLEAVAQKSLFMKITGSRFDTPPRLVCLGNKD